MLQEGAGETTLSLDASETRESTSRTSEPRADRMINHVDVMMLLRLSLGSFQVAQIIIGTLE